MSASLLFGGLSITVFSLRSEYDELEKEDTDEHIYLE